MEISIKSSSRLSISKVGFGCVTFGREIDEEASFALLDYAVERGISFFDTASAYADGASESILGGWLDLRRPEPGSVSIATKLLPPYEPARIRDMVQGSLDRLRVPQVDLLYLHSWDETAESIACLSALDCLVGTGVVRALGVSNFSQEQLANVLGVQDENGFTRFEVVQNNFNYAVSDMCPGYREFCRDEGVKVVTYSPLGAGFLTGKHKAGVEPGSRFDLMPGHQDVYFHAEAEARLAQLEVVAKETGHSQAHLALAWAMHQPGIDCVLVGGRTTGHIDQALAALSFSDSAVFGALGG